MMKAVLRSSVLVALGAAVPLVFRWAVPSKIAKEPVSSFLCFLQPNTAASILGQIDGIPIHRDNLPLDLHSTYLQIESDTYQRLNALNEQIAVRMDAQGSASKTVNPAEVASSESLGANSISDAEAEKYFQENPKAFSNVSFEKVRLLIKEMLTKQERNFVLKGKVDAMRAENRLHTLAPFPCGPKVNIPYSSKLPGRGNKDSGFDVLYVFDYSCKTCRTHYFELQDYLNKNAGSMRLWLMPIPGDQKSLTHHLAAGLQCAYSLDSAKYDEYHKNALMEVSPISLTLDQEILDLVTGIGEKSGYDRNDFAACLSSPETAEQLSANQRFFSAHNLPRAFPRVFINSRETEPNLLGGIVPTLKEIHSEANRIKNQL